MTKHNQKQPLYFLLLLTLFFSWGASAAQLTRGTAIKVQQAYELQSNEQYNEAITSLTAIKSQDSYDQAYVSRMLGWLYWQQKQPKLAIKHLTQAVDLKVLIEQDDLSTQRMLADVLLTEGHYQQAESRYLTLIKAYQDSNNLMQLWLRVAQAQYQQEKWPEVEKSIGKQQAFRKKSKSPAQIMPLNILLTAQLAQKKWSAGITTTRQLRSLAPDNVIWWQQLANLYLYINDNKSALITLQQADRAGLKLSLQQRQLLANLYADAQVPFSAATLYEQLDAENESEQLLQQQAIYWQAAKEWDKAISSWQKVAKLNNQHYWSLARLHLQLHHYQDALQALELLKEKSKHMLLLQVQILDELGNTDLALTTAQKAHEKHPSESTLNWIKYLSNKQTTL